MGKFIFGQEYKCSAQLAIAVEGLFKAARVGLVIPALLHAAPAKLHTALRCVSQGMDGIWGYHLWFLSVRYFISPGTPRAQAWKCLWHSLMLMWVFRAPLLHSCFSFPHVLLGSDLLCFFFFFSHLLVLWQKSSYGATGGRIPAESHLSSVWLRE